MIPTQNANKDVLSVDSGNKRILADEVDSIKFCLKPQFVSDEKMVPIQDKTVKVVHVEVSDKQKQINCGTNWQIVKSSDKKNKFA